MKARTFKRCLLWVLIVFSIGSLIFTPFGSLKEDVISTLPWVGIGVIATEALFIAGLAVMAASMGMKVRNPLKLRGELKNILLAASATNMFWIGFWINAVGAVGSSVVLAFGIFVALPPSSWGLVALVVMDLAVTVTIRGWALRARA